MTMVTVGRFLPQRATPDDLAAWCAVFSDGHGELSGSSVQPSVLAERLLVEDSSAMRWAARSGLASSRVAGVAELRPQLHMPGAGFLRLFVAPSARRGGIGSALLSSVMQSAAAAGMERVQATVLAGPPGEPFARTLPNLRVALRLELQEQRLDQELVLRRCRELAADPLPGYRLAHWNGAAPEPLVASFGRAMGHVLDAPGAALQMAPRAWNTAAVRAWEAKMTAGSAWLMVCAAVHLASGQAVAATVATVPQSGGPVADQHDTVVVPEHRHRGLARGVKAAQALRIHERFPGVRAATSTVSQENLQMKAVNRAVGYHLIHERLLVEAPLASC
ncbi:GNAT family N-acetyltransferase [Streptomyces sp. NPDC002896]|uniref:GNAT family N-acetyltransferase n=1 Tax=Streptomyces sp. NPDC002896 TaxID=3154438 RepID=UPI00332C8ED2